MKRNVLASILGVIMTVSLFGSFNVKAASAVDHVPGGTVVIGDKAISLDYANGSAHTSEITNLVVNSNGAIYVKDFSNQWIDNNSGKVVDSSVVNAKTYTDVDGKTSDLAPNDTDEFQVIGIE